MHQRVVHRVSVVRSRSAGGSNTVSAPSRSAWAVYRLAAGRRLRSMSRCIPAISHPVCLEASSHVRAVARAEEGGRGDQAVGGPRAGDRGRVRADERPRAAEIPRVAAAGGGAQRHVGAVGHGEVRGERAGGAVDVEPGAAVVPRATRVTPCSVGGPSTRRCWTRMTLPPGTWCVSVGPHRATWCGHGDRRTRRSSP